jgi:hypothetical protein
LRLESCCPSKEFFLFIFNERPFSTMCEEQ